MTVVYGSFNLGWLLQYLKRAILSDDPLFEEHLIYDNLIEVETMLDKEGLNGHIKIFIERIKKNIEKYKDIEGAVLEGSDKENSINDIANIYTLIVNELRSVIIFKAVEKCALDKDCLIKLSKQEKSVFFEDDIWGDISDLAKSDFSDAAKCILMGASTPAAMISLRASEDIVRHYYKLKTGEDPGRRDWGALVTDLKKLPEIKKELIEHLDYIRKTRRNLAQHPDKIYSQRQAERIFMDVLSMVHDIYEDIE